MTDSTPSAAHYLAGVLEAEGKFGKECRDFDRAIWGVTAAIRAAGREVTPQDIVGRWHYPLAGADANHSLAHWQAAFTAILRDGMGESFEVVTLRKGADYHWRLDHCGQWPPADTVIDRQAAELIDQQIKQKHPGTRRNTKKYRELADSVRQKARDIIRADMLKATRQKLIELKFWAGSDERQFRAAIESEVRWISNKTEDLAALAPAAADVYEPLRQQAADISRRLTGRIATIDGMIARLEAALAEA